MNFALAGNNLLFGSVSFGRNYSIRYPLHACIIFMMQMTSTFDMSAPLTGMKIFRFSLKKGLYSLFNRNSCHMHNNDPPVMLYARCCLKELVHV